MPFCSRRKGELIVITPVREDASYQFLTGASVRKNLIYRRGDFGRKHFTLGSREAVFHVSLEEQR